MLMTKIMLLTMVILVKNRRLADREVQIARDIAPHLAARASKLIENYKLAKIVTALVFVKMTAVATCRRMSDMPGVLIVSEVTAGLSLASLKWRGKGRPRRN